MWRDIYNAEWAIIISIPPKSDHNDLNVPQ